MPSILESDGYKFSMAEAGWPLRPETFYFSLRRPGQYLIPFDAAEMIDKMLPQNGESVFEQLAVIDEYPYLADHGYAMSPAYRQAMKSELDDLEIRALPKGAVAYENEPIFSVTGPSAVVSWLEPLVLQLHYRIQIASMAEKHPGQLKDAVARVTCQQQKDIILATLADLGQGYRGQLQPEDIAVDEEGYFRRVYARAKRLVEITGDPSRIFEVGLRGATCMEQHLIALRACKEAGITATSNVYGAKELDMKPVGTMGHEHVMRWGDDYEAFAAMRDRRVGPISMLVDTYSTVFSGLVQAFRVIRDDPDKGHSIRFDSGNIPLQLTMAVEKAKEWNIRPRWIIEDGLDADKTAGFENLRKLLDVLPEDVSYGYGGYLVDEWRPGEGQDDPRGIITPMTRNRVSAVWKLSESDFEATMKFGDGGKASIPGVPVVWRKQYQERGRHTHQTIIAQEFEHIEGAQKITGNNLDELKPYRYENKARYTEPFVYSPEIKKLVKKLKKERRKMLMQWEDLV